MQCEEVREQFADYVIDALEEPTATLVSEHLSSCESCRTEAEELKSLWTNLGLIPAAEPTPQLRSRFQMMLQAYQHGMGQASSKNRWESLNSWITGWWPSRPALQLSLSLGLLMLGIVAGRQFQTVTSVPATQPNNEVAELR